MLDGEKVVITIAEFKELISNYTRVVSAGTEDLEPGDPDYIVLDAEGLGNAFENLAMIQDIENSQKVNHGNKA